jgi:hypothetical protein
MEELNSVKDLVEGTLFKIYLDDYLNGEGNELLFVFFYFESFSIQNSISKIADPSPRLTYSEFSPTLTFIGKWR